MKRKRSLPRARAGGNWSDEAVFIGTKNEFLSGRDRQALYLRLGVGAGENLKRPIFKDTLLAQKESSLSPVTRPKTSPSIPLDFTGQDLWGDSFRLGNIMWVTFS
jgi:hypothetical protein